ncbi:MAG: molybdopterin molybdotransferase MoeA [Clostridiales bacterium]|nr:molybdopterin molybdotransferase MoeA [Clostridiales bacterium]
MKNNVFELEDALTLVLDRCRCLSTEVIPLEKASGRVLASDLNARYDVPLFDKSPLDGYAFHASDTKSASRDNPLKLAVAEEIPAGAYPHKKLKKGYAAKILTGAPVPEGADAIVKFEDTESSDGYVTLFQSFRSGDNIVHRGEDVSINEIIAPGGTVIDAAVHGMIASQGFSAVEVYKVPLIGIISQGNELLEPGDTLHPGKIYNSNRYMLTSALKKEGFSSIYLGSVQDNLDEITNYLQDAVSMYDVVIMTGGVSVGTYDFTEAALERAGADILVDKVKMKPGSSCCMAFLNGVPVFGLSGNPSAAMTTFHLITVPALRKISGQAEYRLQKISVRLAETFKKKSPNMRILKGRLSLENGSAVFHLNQHQENGSVSAMKNAEVFAVIPAGSGSVHSGTVLDAYVIS